MTIDELDEFEERAAIMQFEAGMTRERAEQEARNRIDERKGRQATADADKQVGIQQTLRFNFQAYTGPHQNTSPNEQK
jgi:hypothetical protein